MQKKYLPSLSDSKQELEDIKQIQDILNFSKIQHLAFIMADVIKDSDFTGIKLIGIKEGEYNDEGMYPGVYFDAKTATQGYSGFHDLYEPYGDEYDEYSDRMDYTSVENPFRFLEKLNRVVDEFFSVNSDIENLQYALGGPGFTKDPESILKLLFTPEQLAEWNILKEQHNLEHEIPSAVSTSTPSTKKTVKRSNKKI